jgi:hypothetical protein
MTVLFKSCLIVAALMLSCIWLANTARADFLVKFGEGPVARYDDAGNEVKVYWEVYDHLLNFVWGEEALPHWTASEDGQTFYLLSNTLGFTGIFAVDVATGALVGPGFDTYFSGFPAAPNDIFAGHAARVAWHGLYVVSDVDPYISPIASIKVYDTINGDFLRSLDLPSGMDVLDMAVTGFTLHFPSGVTYTEASVSLLTHNGIYFGQFMGDLENPHTNLSIASAKSPAVTGDTAIIAGDDEYLYVTNSTMHEIRRVPFGSSDSGSVYLDSVDLGMTPSCVAFGPDGDLYVLGSTYSTDIIKRYDSTDAHLVSATELPRVWGSDTRFYILPSVPEPTAIWLAAIAALVCCGRICHFC